MGGLSFGNYRLDTLKNAIYRDGQVLELEPQVYSLLELLITRHGELVSRDEMIASVWGGRVVSNNVIDNRILGARVAIGDTGKTQRYIKTYPNRGYKFVGEVRLLEENMSPSQAGQIEIDAAEDVIKTQSSALRPSFSFLRSPVACIMLGVICGVFGSYGTTQISKKLDRDAPSNIAAMDVESYYNVTSLDEKQALPRVAILPFETIGDSSNYGLLPDVLESEFNHIITAIKGLTVVSLIPDSGLKSDFANYKILKEEFELDYVISSKMSSYGEYFKLNVSLIHVDNGSVLSNETYNLNLSNEAEVPDLLADIASKATLTTANNLNLSVDDLPKSWKNYDFYVKIQEAEALAELADYESMVKATQLLREAIQDEPNYIPAYSKLILFLSWQAHFLVGDSSALHKEQVELAIKMQEISASSPETLIMNSAMGTITEDGVGKSSLGELVETDPMSVIDYILKKDPDNFLAMSMRADMSVFETDQAETVRLYEEALRLSPTDPFTLPEYSWALFCNQDFRKAREALTRASKWHPNHRTALLAELRQAHALGRYEVALNTAKRLLEQGVINFSESVPLIALFVDLGKPELARPHVRFPPDKAYLYAMMNNKDAAIRESRVIERFSTSVRARMIIDDTYIPQNYTVDRTYARVGIPGDKTRANMCRLDYLIRDSHILNQLGSDKFKAFLPLLIDYFKDRDVETLKTRQEYTALMGLHILQGDNDKALEVMDVAMDRGFHFIGSFREPFLRDLTAHPEFSKRLSRMQTSADFIIAQFYN